MLAFYKKIIKMSNTRQQNISGEKNIQYPDITSSHLFKLPYETRFLIKGRKSYKKCLQCPRDSFIEKDLSHQSSSHMSTKAAIITVLSVFITFLIILYSIYRTFPNVTPEEKQFIKLPYTLEDAKNLGIVLNRYKGDHYYEVMAGVFCVYIFLQTFAIPGSLFLSILSGFLFPFFVALALVCTCSALGASLCFLVSQLLGRKFILTYWPEKVQKWEKQVDKHRDNLLNYMVFLRVTPLVPNWFINLTAPVIGVPLIPFALGTFLGVAPPSFIAIQGGQTLNKMTSTDSAFSIYSMGMLIVFGIISLLPVLLKNKIKHD